MDTKRLKKIIDKDRRSIHQIAKDAEVDHPALYNLYHGKRKYLRDDRLFRLADALGVDINEFREE